MTYFIKARNDGTKDGIRSAQIWKYVSYILTYYTQWIARYILCSALDFKIY